MKKYELFSILSRVPGLMGSGSTSDNVSDVFTTSDGLFDYRTFSDGSESDGLDADGLEVAIVKYNGSDFSNVVIPDFIDDKPVTGIAKSVFRGTDLKKVKLSKNLKYIWYDAFAQTKLGYVSLPKSIHFICDGAFEDCSRLRIVTGYKKLGYHHESDEPNGRIRVSIRNSIREHLSKGICKTAFRGCEKLQFKCYDLYYECNYDNHRSILQSSMLVPVYVLQEEDDSNLERILKYKWATDKMDATPGPVPMGRIFSFTSKATYSGPGMSWVFTVYFVKLGPDKWLFHADDDQACCPESYTDGFGKADLLSECLYRFLVSSQAIEWAKFHEENVLLEALSHVPYWYNPPMDLDD